MPIAFRANSTTDLIAWGARFLKERPWTRLWRWMVYSRVTTSLRAERVLPVLSQVLSEIKERRNEGKCQTFFFVVLVTCRWTVSKHSSELQAQTHHYLDAVGDDDQGGICVREIRVCVACKLHGISRGIRCVKDVQIQTVILILSQNKGVFLLRFFPTVRGQSIIEMYLSHGFLIYKITHSPII